MHRTQGNRRVLERRGGAGFLLPPDTAILEETALQGDDGPYLRGYLELAATRRTPHDAGAITAIESATGLTRSEAAVLWGGMSKLETYGNDFLGKPLREALGLKLADAKLGRATLLATTHAQRLDILLRAAPEDPAELFEPMPRAERLAKAWNSVMGQRVALPEDLVIACERELDPQVRAAELLAALLSPDSAPMLRIKERPWWEIGGWSQPKDTLALPALSSLALLVPWIFGALPVGDAARDALPKLCSTVLARLDDAALWLPLATLHAEEKGAPQLRALFEAIGGVSREMSVDAQGTKAESRESGGLSAAILRKDQYVQVLFQPSALDADSKLAWQIVASSGGSPALTAVRLLRSEGYRAMKARVLDTPVPRGRYEADPRVSAPQALKALGQQLDLTEDAATLYLQTLALAEPTQKNVLLWNGWKPAEYKKAAAALLAKKYPPGGRNKLVSEGKRERAGREIFLPGGWDKGLGRALPMERWKQPSYALDRGQLPRTSALRPLHTLFEEAVARVAAGDIPSFTEV